MKKSILAFLFLSLMAMKNLHAGTTPDNFSIYVHPIDQDTIPLTELNYGTFILGTNKFNGFYGIYATIGTNYLFNLPGLPLNQNEGLFPGSVTTPYGFSMLDFSSSDINRMMSAKFMMANVDCPYTANQIMQQEDLICQCSFI